MTYVVVSTTVDTSVIVVVSQSVVVSVWSTVLVVGWILVVFTSSQQYITLKDWNFLQVKLLSPASSARTVWR